MPIVRLCSDNIEFEKKCVHVLQAAKETGRRVKVWAVEKNPNAIIHIQHLVASQG